MLAKGVAREAALSACHSLSRADAEHRVQEGELGWHPWDGVLLPLCLGVPTTPWQRCCRQYPQAVSHCSCKFGFPLTGILIDKGAQHVAATQLAALPEGQRQVRSDTSRRTSESTYRLKASTQLAASCMSDWHAVLTNHLSSTLSLSCYLANDTAAWLR